MKSPFLRSAAAVLAVVTLLLSASPAIAQLRTINSPTSLSGAYPSSPGCDSNVQTSMVNASQYAYTQAYSTAYNTIHAPQSIASCLQGLMSLWQTICNMFAQPGGFNIGSFLTSFATALVNRLVQQLLTLACTTVQSVVGGAVGSLGPVSNIAGLFSGMSSGGGGSLGSTAGSAAGGYLGGMIP